MGDTLVDKVDQLNTKESAQFIKKPFANIFHPMPEDLISNLGIGIGRSVHSFKQGDNTQHNVAQVETFWGTSKYLMFKYNDKISIGFNFYNADVERSGVIDTNTLFQHNIDISYIHLIYSYIYYKEYNMTLSVYGGAGSSDVSYSISQFSPPSAETPSASRHNKFKGSSISYQLGAAASYKLNDIWSFGLSVSYLQSMIKEVKGLDDTKVDDYNMGGTLFQVFTGINLF